MLRGEGNGKISSHILLKSVKESGNGHFIDGHLGMLKVLLQGNSLKVTFRKDKMLQRNQTNQNYSTLMVRTQIEDPREEVGGFFYWCFIFFLSLRNELYLQMKMKTSWD